MIERHGAKSWKTFCLARLRGSATESDLRMCEVHAACRGALNVVAKVRCRKTQQGHCDFFFDRFNHESSRRLPMTVNPAPCRITDDSVPRWRTQTVFKRDADKLREFQPNFKVIVPQIVCNGELSENFEILFLRDSDFWKEDKSSVSEAQCYLARQGPQVCATASSISKFCEFSKQCSSTHFAKHDLRLGCSTVVAGYAWAVLEVCLGYACMVLEICLRNAWSLLRVGLKYAWSTLGENAFFWRVHGTGQSRKHALSSEKGYLKRYL